MSYEFIPHTADIKFIAKGKTIEKAFIESANATLKSINPNKKVSGKIERKIEITSNIKELLLYEFLEEIIFLLEAEDFLTGKVKDLLIKKDTLKATLTGDSIKNHPLNNKVKAVTFSDMQVNKEKSGYSCTVVLDI